MTNLSLLPEKGKKSLDMKLLKRVLKIVIKTRGVVLDGCWLWWAGGRTQFSLGTSQYELEPANEYNWTWCIFPFFAGEGLGMCKGGRVDWEEWESSVIGCIVQYSQIINKTVMLGENFNKSSFQLRVIPLSVISSVIVAQSLGVFSV